MPLPFPTGEVLDNGGGENSTIKISQWFLSYRKYMYWDPTNFSLLVGGILVWSSLSSEFPGRLLDEKGGKE